MITWLRNLLIGAINVSLRKGFGYTTHTGLHPQIDPMNRDPLPDLLDTHWTQSFLLHFPC